MLPDTYGTTQFLADAPDWTADWTGQRIDSKDPYLAGGRIHCLAEAAGPGPKQKLIIASDAMDVEDILGLHAYFMGTMARWALRPRTFTALPTSMTPPSGLPAGASVSAPDGAPC